MIEELPKLIELHRMSGKVHEFIHEDESEQLKINYLVKIIVDFKTIMWHI